MIDASGPQRIEMLGSNGGEMKVELPHTRAQIEQMMGMVQQLLQAKSADGDQQENKSSGTGRGDASDDSGGAGKAPREERTAGARVGATTAAAAGERVSNNSSRASDGSKPADDTGRRPEVLIVVGPMINMQRGETRDSFLAGISAHDGGGFWRQPRVVPHVLK